MVDSQCLVNRSLTDVIDIVLKKPYDAPLCCICPLILFGAVPFDVKTVVFISLLPILY